MAQALDSQLQAIKEALQSVNEPSPAVKRARSNYARLERILGVHQGQPEAAVEAYNAARIELVRDWARQKRLGYCSSSRHLAAVDQIEGLIVSGASVSSGYYEALQPFENRKTICREHRHGLRSGAGRYRGEFTTYHTFELKDPSDSLSYLASDWDIEQLAKANGIELPPKATYDQFNGGVKIGGLVVE